MMWAIWLSNSLNTPCEREERIFPVSLIVGAARPCSVFTPPSCKARDAADQASAAAEPTFRLHVSLAPSHSIPTRLATKVFTARSAISAVPFCMSTIPAAAPAPAASAAGPKVMVTAANPLAVEAGLNVLRQGGSAVDAAVAVQAVLSLVEPQSSGVGGGAFMTFYDAKTKKVVAYNGRETAPAGATETMFLDASGKPLT